MHFPQIPVGGSQSPHFCGTVSCLYEAINIYRPELIKCWWLGFKCKLQTISLTENEDNGRCVQSLYLISLLCWAGDMLLHNCRKVQIFLPPKHICILIWWVNILKIANSKLSSLTFSYTTGILALQAHIYTHGLFAISFRLWPSFSTFLLTLAAVEFSWYSTVVQSKCAPASVRSVYVYACTKRNYCKHVFCECSVLSVFGPVTALYV